MHADGAPSPVAKALTRPKRQKKRRVVGSPTLDMNVTAGFFKALQPYFKTKNSIKA